MNKQMKKQWADKLGITSAILCIIHCLTLPSLMIMGFGFLSHPIVTVLFVSVSFISIFTISKEKVGRRLITFFWFASFGLVISMVLEGQLQIFAYTSYLFSLAIIVGHVVHMRYHEGGC